MINKFEKLGSVHQKFWTKKVEDMIKDIKFSRELTQEFNTQSGMKNSNS